MVDAQLALLDWHLRTPNENQRLYYLFMALGLVTLILRIGVPRVRASLLPPRFLALKTLVFGGPGGRERAKQGNAG